MLLIISIYIYLYSCFYGIDNKDMVNIPNEKYIGKILIKNKYKIIIK